MKQLAKEVYVAHEDSAKDDPKQIADAKLKAGSVPVGREVQRQYSGGHLP